MQIRVGFFDSGIGGLTVLAACRRRFPALSCYYLGDNARAPYGNRPAEEVAAFTREALMRFSALGVDAAVIACNTATAVCLPALREQFPFPVLGTEPAVLPAARAAREILVLCTPRTAQSDRLKALAARCPHCLVTVRACPGLAEAIERRFARGERVELQDHLPGGRYGAVVLGCTHYAFLAEEIAAFYSAPVFDGAEGVARRLEHFFPALAVDAEWREKDKINKSSLLNGAGVEQNETIFLGESANFNRYVYEHTFINHKR